MAITKKRATPSQLRRKKAQQRIRKQIKRKTDRKAPSWKSALKKSYTEDMGKRKDKLIAEQKAKKKNAAKRARDGEDPEEEGEGLSRFDDELLKGGNGEEVQEEVDEEKMKRMNERNPLETQLFLKNMPVDMTEEELMSFMTRYGEIRKVFLVRNRITKMPTGTGFVHCGSAELADQIYALGQQNAREVSTASQEKMADKTKGLTRHRAKALQYKLKSDVHEIREPFLTIRNTRVSVHKVLSRTDSHEVSAAQQKKKNRTKTASDDPRNLYLVQEGYLAPDSEAVRDLPPHYVASLQRDYEARKMTLRNSNFYVSRTRLNIRHIPKKLNVNEVRKIFSDHARKYLKKHPEDADKDNWGKYGPIKNIKLLQDNEGESRGYGFIEFVNHEIALNVLRSTNNNPTIFGPNQRLVVSFAVENMTAVQKLSKIREVKQERRKRDGFGKPEVDPDAEVGFE